MAAVQLETVTSRRVNLQKRQGSPEEQVQPDAAVAAPPKAAQSSPDSAAAEEPVSHHVPAVQKSRAARVYPQFATLPLDNGEVRSLEYWNDALLEIETAAKASLDAVEALKAVAKAVEAVARHKQTAAEAVVRALVYQRGSNKMVTNPAVLEFFMEKVLEAETMAKAGKDSQWWMIQEQMDDILRKDDEDERLFLDWHNVESLLPLDAEEAVHGASLGADVQQGSRQSYAEAALPAAVTSSEADDQAALQAALAASAAETQGAGDPDAEDEASNDADEAALQAALTASEADDQADLNAALAASVAEIQGAGDPDAEDVALNDEDEAALQAALAASEVHSPKLQAALAASAAETQGAGDSDAEDEMLQLALQQSLDDARRYGAAQ